MVHLLQKPWDRVSSGNIIFTESTPILDVSSLFFSSLPPPGDYTSFSVPLLVATTTPLFQFSGRLPCTVIIMIKGL